MCPNRHWRICALAASALAVTWLGSARAVAADCNNNGVNDIVDIANGTSQDCDLNGVPDECQPDSDANGTIDACDNCGLQLTTDDVDEFWGIRQRSTSQGNVLWYQGNATADDVFFFGGDSVQLIQSQMQNSEDLGFLSNTVFGLGNGAAAGQVLGGWRRGTDLAYVWANDGQPPRQVKYTNPYDPTRKMNAEDVAIADGCIFMIFQAADLMNASLTKHVFQIDPVSGNAKLLTGAFLTVTQNGGSGAEPGTLVTSGCKAAWSWCGQGNAGTCTGTFDLHYWNGTATAVIDSDARALSFARGRLIYSKPVGGVTQLFLFDTNVTTPTPTQLTTSLPADKQILFAQTDGRNVAILLGDANGQNRQIDLLDNFPLTDAASQPIDTPPNLLFPFQLQRGQMLWADKAGSVLYFNGRSFDPVCSDGWLADGFIAELRKAAGTGTDTEVFLFTGTPPNDEQQPTPPLGVLAVATGNGEVTVSWSRVLGATGYNVYFAQQSGVNKANFATLPGGGVKSSAASPLKITGLTGSQAWFFAVSSIEGSAEGAVSPEGTATACLDPTADADKDGTPDCSDACPNDPNKTAPGACGCGVADTDSDNDGTPDCKDGCPNDPNKTAPGVCGCGVPDTDSDGDGTPDCNDGCPNDPNKTAPGACGCGLSDADTNGDGTPDCTDLCPDDPNKTEPGSCGCGTPDVDADNNGIIDCEEVSAEEPEQPGQGCAPGLCGPGVVPVLAVALLGMGAMRRLRRRA